MSEKKISVETLGKEELRELLEVVGRLWLTIDGLWIQSVERELGTEKCLEMYTKIMEQNGAIEARRIGRFLGIAQEKAKIEDVITARGLFGGGVETEPRWISDKEVILDLYNCRPQQARKEKGQSIFPCKTMELAHLSAFTRQLNPKLKVECLFCPPDERPADLPEKVSCRWKITEVD